MINKHFIITFALLLKQISFTNAAGLELENFQNLANTNTLISDFQPPKTDVKINNNCLGSLKEFVGKNFRFISESTTNIVRKITSLDNNKSEIQNLRKKIINLQKKINKMDQNINLLEKTLIKNDTVFRELDTTFLLLDNENNLIKEKEIKIRKLLDEIKKIIKNIEGKTDLKKKNNEKIIKESVILIVKKSLRAKCIFENKDEEIIRIKEEKIVEEVIDKFEKIEKTILEKSLSSTNQTKSNSDLNLVKMFRKIAEDAMYKVEYSLLPEIRNINRKNSDKLIQLEINKQKLKNYKLKIRNKIKEEIKKISDLQIEQNKIIDLKESILIEEQDI